MAFGDLNDPATLVIIALVVVIAVIVCVTVIYFMRQRPKQPKQPPKKPETEIDTKGLPFRLSKSVQTNDATHAKDELRILDLERDILSDALRRLYEAHAEGKISEQERDRLAATYKSRMTTVKESIAKDETIVALHELESMQEDLMKLFSERFGDLTSKVDELRTRIDLKPIKEIKVQLPTTETSIEAEEIEEEEGAGTGEKEAEKPKTKRKSPEKPSEKSEAEKRIDEIRGEVEKVLDKLGQMEVET
jgi:flagellar basal body-associated protein FliL